MKKVLTITAVIAAFILTLTLSACDTGAQEVQNRQTVPIEPLEAVSVEEAVSLFKADPFAEVDGYKLDDLGILYKDDERLNSVHLFGVGVAPDADYVANSRHYVIEKSGRTLRKLSFGEVIATYTVSPDARYCGLCEDYFLFREGNTVFVITEDLSESKVIGEGIKLVVSRVYDLSPDNYAVPLFLMEDGSLMAYDAINDTLAPISQEGGYGGAAIE